MMMGRDCPAENLVRGQFRGSLTREQLTSIAPGAITSYAAAEVIGKLIVLGVVLSFSFSTADPDNYHGHAHHPWRVGQDIASLERVAGTSDRGKSLQIPTRSAKQPFIRSPSTCCETRNH